MKAQQKSVKCACVRFEHNAKITSILYL